MCDTEDRPAALGDPADNTPLVCIVLVNWNGAVDTMKCLESLFAMDYARFAVIVCDNGSTDDSLGVLERWAGEVGSGLSLSWEVCDRQGQPQSASGASVGERVDHPYLTLVEVGENLGFAGGCNVGMRLAMGWKDCDFVWLLNNDTTVDRRALSELVDELTRRPGAGLCGSTILVSGEGERVQALGGGTYDPWLGRTRLLTIGRLPTGAEMEREAERVRRDMDFIVGASILVPRSWWEEVGPMTEDYFLYFEELDWVAKACGKVSLAYAAHSIVHHDIGGSIGSSMEPRNTSLLADYYGIRNRILFTRRHHPLCLPTVYIGLLGALMLRVVRGQSNRVGMILSLALWGLGLMGEEQIRQKYGSGARLE